MNAYILIDSGYPFIFHWFCFMIGTLRFIPSTDDPVKIWFEFSNSSTVQEYHHSSLQILNDKYIFEKPEPNDTIFHLPKEKLLNNCDLIDSEVFVFLRNLYNSRIISVMPSKLRFVYISRNDSTSSNPANNGRIMRRILNEHEFKSDIEALGFEIIELGNMPFVEKVKLFQTASIVVSPHGSALVFSIFANPKIELIEILPEGVAMHNHYRNSCSALNLVYTRFSNVTIVGDTPSLYSNWNMNVNIPLFINLLKQKTQLFL